MILTGSIYDRIPQIYLNNPLDYDVVLDVLHATIDSEYENTGTTVYHQHLSITNILYAYTGSTSDEYIRCSGSTDSGSTYTIFLPYSTGTGNILTIKNIDQGIITVSAQDSETIDYSLLPISLSGMSTLRLIDASNYNWDII